MMFPVIPEPARMADRQVLIDGYLHMITPGREPIPVDDGSGLDLPSDLEMALYVVTNMLAEFERDNGIDCDDNQYREAVLILTRLVHDVGTGSVLKRCASVLGVPPANLETALGQCPSHVAQLFGTTGTEGELAGDLPPHDPSGAMALILGDLDRCQHGVRAGEPCLGYDPDKPRSGCAGGFSHGNPFLVPGQPIGYNAEGDVYVVPSRGEETTNPQWWLAPGMPAGYEHPDDDPERRIGGDGNLFAAAHAHLTLCPLHDAGFAVGACACPDRGDYRSVILALVRALEMERRRATRRPTYSVTVQWINDDLFNVCVDGEEVYPVNYDNVGSDGMDAVRTVAGIVARKLGATFSEDGETGR